jgi:hypothetical protein
MHAYNFRQSFRDVQAVLRKISDIQRRFTTLSMKKSITQFFLLLCCLGTWGTVSSQTFMNFTVQQSPAPVAGFTYTSSNLTFNFSDLSSGTPVSWHWSFGNGDTSALQNPTYTYPDGGNFIICLTVWDDHNCSATSCDTITLVGLDQPAPFRDVTLQPNPFTGYTLLQYQLDHAARVRIQVFNLQGALVERVAHADLPAGAHSHTLGAGLAQGSYMVVLEVEGRSMTRKLIKVH